MTEPISVALAPALIVEDVATTRTYLTGILRGLCGADADIVAVDSLAAARTALTERSRPFVLVDIGLPDGNGIELIEWLHARYPQTVSMVVSAWGDEDTVLNALRAGATGYLFKERDTDELRAALQSIQRGGAPIDPFVARRILDVLLRDDAKPAPVAHRDAADSALTQRETEVLQLVERGCSNRDIAAATGLSRFTVEGYIKTIYRKLAVSSRTSAVHAAKARGWLG